LVLPVAVVVIDVVGGEPVELVSVPDVGPIEEFTAQAADPPFSEAVRDRGSDRCLEDLHSFASEDLVERVDELAGSVTHQRPDVGE